MTYSCDIVEDDWVLESMSQGMEKRAPHSWAKKYLMQVHRFYDGNS
jgi:hypothetical protein